MEHLKKYLKWLKEEVKLESLEPTEKETGNMAWYRHKIYQAQVKLIKRIEDKIYDMENTSGPDVTDSLPSKPLC